MILIADSGATKTDWLINDVNKPVIVKTEGINPFHQDEKYIRKIIETDLLPQIQNDGNIEKGNISDIYFYGAGCLPELAEKIINILQDFFTGTKVHAYSDLMGAARALCGKNPGIACILGTGSNSCMYDGKDIIRNVSPLGYILGDEGSGAYLGKRFISDCLKGHFPENIKNDFLSSCNLSVEDILRKVYREPQANRFLASITPYIYSIKQEAQVKSFLCKCFADFFERNVMKYDTSLEISFTGSVSWFFQEEIKETAKRLDLKTGKFIKEPIWGLKEFHNNQ